MSTFDNSENFLVIQVDVSCHTKWLGKDEGKQTFDFIVCTIDELYSIFKNWKDNNKDLDTSMLDLRVSADLECIISEDEPSFWTSHSLNRFVKNEKIITIRGVAINRTIVEKLNPELRDRFKNIQLIDRFNKVHFHIDSIHVYEINKECPSGFKGT